MQINGLDAVFTEGCPKDRAFLIPNIVGLCVVNGELKVKETVMLHTGQTAHTFRDLTDDEQKRFAVLRL